MNLGQLRDAVYQNLGGEGGVTYDANMGVDFVTRVLNAGLQLMETEHDWPWLDETETLSFTSGTASYTPASNWLRTRELWIDTYEPLTYKSYSDLDTTWPYATVTGIPSLYTIYESTIIVRPVPNASFSCTHRYVKSEPDLADDGDTPLLPSRYHDALVTFATMQGCRRLRRFNEASIWGGDWAAWLKRMQDDQQRAKAPGRVRIRPGLWDQAPL